MSGVNVVAFAAAAFIVYFLWIQLSNDDRPYIPVTPTKSTTLVKILHWENVSCLLHNNGVEEQRHEKVVLEHRSLTTVYTVSKDEDALLLSVVSLSSLRDNTRIPFVPLIFSTRSLCELYNDLLLINKISCQSDWKSTFETPPLKMIQLAFNTLFISNGDKILLLCEGQETPVFRAHHYSEVASLMDNPSLVSRTSVPERWIKTLSQLDNQYPFVDEVVVVLFERNPMTLQFDLYAMHRACTLKKWVDMAVKCGLPKRVLPNQNLEVTCKHSL